MLLTVRKLLLAKSPKCEFTKANIVPVIWLYSHKSKMRERERKKKKVCVLFSCLTSSIIRSVNGEGKRWLNLSDDDLECINIYTRQLSILASIAFCYLDACFIFSSDAFRQK